MSKPYIYIYIYILRNLQQLATINGSPAIIKIQVFR